MNNLFIGLMSGTSLDAIDTVLTDLDSNQISIIATHQHPIPDVLRNELLELMQVDARHSLVTLGRLDQQLGQLFADAVNALLADTAFTSQDIQAIGSHGQTIAHYPDEEYPFSLQIGDANQIAQQTGITTICDFRRRDIAAGGQGAPLAPAFHQAFFQDKKHERIILNIGGMANITHLPTDPLIPTTGFDTGPGNVLMDAWMQQQQQQLFDRDGSWAASGKIHPALLQQLLDTPYFQLKPPKSTGRETFNLDWLNAKLGERYQEIPAQDIQATLVELTASTIAQGISASCQGGQILTCGGGTHNQYLIQRLQQQLPVFNIASTAEHGIDPDWVEAVAFAWLAQQTLNSKAGNLPAVTGATQETVLGGIYSR
ncbi:MAG: anhydro-N-acetylmuramic acid kinase [Gammaproteobacteria bacterium]|nr:anhydro-N-acetylmuramic acid kinase [Gammaproteobacteria bacterium]